MNVAVMSRPFRAVLAPLTWLERARGRRRLALASLYALLLAVAGVFAWREASLRGLPDVGDPFDVEADGTIRVAEADNAYVLYKQAGARLRPAKLEGARPSPNVDWGLADEATRRWVDENREALELWRRGSERPAAVYHQPREYTIETGVPAAQDLREFGRMALLEGSRRERAGDLAGAWALYRAALRSSRHVGRHGGAVERLIGSAMLRAALDPVDRWAADPRPDAALLRRALDDVAACQAMTGRNSDMLKVEYFAVMNALDGPLPAMRQDTFADADAWYNQLAGVDRARLFLAREPERSRRVVRLVFANWLAQADKPAERRPPVVVPELRIYAADPTTPPAARALSPKELERWAKSSRFAMYLLPALNPIQGHLATDRSRLELLALTLAERLYHREHGRPPARLGDLVGPYLKQLPVGFEPDDGPTLAPNSPATP